VSARLAAIAAALALAGCGRGRPAPAPLDTRHDACAHCRMAVSDARFAAQLVAPREEPRFFDDVGCLRDWLRASPPLPRGAVAYVADHRTKEWGRAAAAAYARAPGVSTPMGSHLLAHRDPASRAADPAAAGSTPLDAAAVFGGPPPDGAPAPAADRSGKGHLGAADRSGKGHLGEGEP
jgi:copper chaperone NosL